MDKFFGIMVMAVIVEGLIAYANMIVSPNKVIKWECVAAIVFGVFIGIAYNLDLLAVFGVISPLPFVGCALTGVLLSRGSNYIADLVKVLTNLNGKYKKEC